LHVYGWLPPDITLGDTVDTLGVEVKHFQTDVAKLCLTLNESKCEIICVAEESRQQWNSFGFTFQEPPPDEAMLLGAPLLRIGFSLAVTRHRNTLVSLTERIKYLSANEGSIETL